MSVGQTPQTVKSRFTTENNKNKKEKVCPKQKDTNYLKNKILNQKLDENTCAARVFSVFRRYALYRTHVRRRDRIGEMQLPF